MRWALIAGCLATAVVPVSDASAAEVFTKDQGLEGSVVGVTAEGVAFQTIYGKGAILIQWSDIEMRTTTENRLLGRTRLDHDLTGRIFAFGQVSAEYDEIQNLSLRTDPVVGVGYRFVAREKLTISGRTGPGYVYQRYFGGETEDYFTILFGGDLEADLPYGSKLRWRAEYLPAVSDWKDNYLIRTIADWTMPIIDWLDFKLAVFEIYNSRPAPDTERNTFTTTAGVSFRF